MMDGAYFVSRAQLLSWINSKLPNGIQLTQVDECKTALPFLSICARLLFPQTAQLIKSKIRANIKSDLDAVMNYRLLFDALDAAGVRRSSDFDAERLASGNLKMNLEFLQWFVHMAQTRLQRQQQGGDAAHQSSSSVSPSAAEKSHHSPQFNNSSTAQAASSTITRLKVAGQRRRSGAAVDSTAAMSAENVSLASVSSATAPIFAQQRQQQQQESNTESKADSDLDITTFDDANDDVAEAKQAGLVIGNNDDDDNDGSDTATPLQSPVRVADEVEEGDDASDNEQGTAEGAPNERLRFLSDDAMERDGEAQEEEAGEEQEGEDGDMTSSTVQSTSPSQPTSRSTTTKTARVTTVVGPKKKPVKSYSSPKSTAASKSTRPQQLLQQHQQQQKTLFSRKVNPARSSVVLSNTAGGVPRAVSAAAQQQRQQQQQQQQQQSPEWIEAERDFFFAKLCDIERIVLAAAADSCSCAASNDETSAEVVAALAAQLRAVLYRA